MQKDHYVSQFLLKAFSVNGVLQVFNKKTGKVKSKTSSQICYELGFTTFEKSNFPPDLEGEMKIF